MFTVNSGWETFLSITDVLDHKVLENPMTCMIKKKSVNSESLRYRVPSTRQRSPPRWSTDAAPAAESGWRCESRGGPRLRPALQTASARGTEPGGQRASRFQMCGNGRRRSAVTRIPTRSRPPPPPPLPSSLSFFEGNSGVWDSSRFNSLRKP